MLGAEDRPVGVVVEDDEVRTPEENDLRLRGSSMLRVLRRLCGQLSTGPSDVFAQSRSRIRAPISPPPWRNVRLDQLVEELCAICELCRSNRRPLGRLLYLS